MAAVAFTVERAALLAPLAAAEKIIEQRNTIPILSNVLIKVDAEGLRLVATDLDIQITARVPADVTATGAITVPAKTLHDLVKRLPASARITIEQAKLDGHVVFQAGKVKAKINTLPAENYPDITDGAFERTFSIAGADLAALLGRTEFAISDEETRYYLNGTFITVLDRDTPVLRAVSTDGHRLAKVETTLITDVAGEAPGVIVPTKAVAELRRLGEAAKTDPITIDVSRAKLRAAHSDTVFTTKLIDGTFPDYERVIPLANPHRAVVATATLKAALERVLVMSTENGNAVRFTFTDHRLELCVRSPERGEIFDELDAEFDAEHLVTGFNGKYVLEQLTQIGTDTLTFKLADPGSPALVMEREDAQAVFVLMPMRA